MHLFTPKLKKLSILAFESVERTGRPIDTFVAMYNPESFSQTYSLEFLRRKRVINSSAASSEYAFSEPNELRLKLILDGTGVESYGIQLISHQQSVSERVKHFIKLVYRYNGQIHEPNYLLVEWGGQQDGGLSFSCRLKSVTVNYTSFERDGTPLRAELDIVLHSDIDPKKRALLEYKRSPDVTHTVTVQPGDTLPMLSRRIYGSSKHYLMVAEFNQLDHFRALHPGQSLRFPPLASTR